LLSRGAERAQVVETVGGEDEGDWHGAGMGRRIERIFDL